ncbi:HAD family hydrolase [Litoreibacter arenae]|uniref:Haloacid dehalogenase n=1 Tax=Litoreibacter arenae DSM 19593 TaxID=1123360 RepID=S9QN47_9RHOB|nr:HAD family phosphatase [Litoreibacter arenae]EPX81097.1 haloacid dehalogenase [Litoreibacter arenae DSM 19593]
MGPSPAAVIFDLDGCLVDSEPLVIRAIVEELRAEGLDTLAFDDIRAGFLGMPMPAIWDAAAQGTGRPIPDDFITRVDTRLCDAFVGRLQRIDGVLGMLDALAERGVAIAIATGGSIQRMTQALAVSGLSARFEGRAFSANQVARGKPAPDLFLFAADRLGVAPTDCAVLEDSPHGVAGGVAAGMRVAGFTGGSHLDGMRDAHTQLLRDKGAATVATDMDGVLSALWVEKQ